jgi:hypothetical protein
MVIMLSLPEPAAGGKFEGNEACPDLISAPPSQAVAALLFHRGRWAGFHAIWRVCLGRLYGLGDCLDGLVELIVAEERLACGVSQLVPGFPRQMG